MVIKQIHRFSLKISRVNLKTVFWGKLDSQYVYDCFIKDLKRHLEKYLW